MNPIPHTRLTLVSDNTVATYSGMLAGTLAGQYEPRDMEIDLIRLCASCGVRFVQAKTMGHDVAGRRLLLEDRPPVNYDLLSVGIGSRPAIPTGGEGGLSIKPMQTFLPRLRAKIDETLSQRTRETLLIAIVGGGAAGVEITSCLLEFLKQNYPSKKLLNITLVEAAGRLLNEMPHRPGRLATRKLLKQGIQLRFHSRIAHVEHDQQLIFEDGHKLAADIVIWATSAKPPALLSQLNLPLDECGFLLTHSTLQSTGSDEVFAVGDTGTVAGEHYDKAGVYAVRQGPVLWENLRRKIQGQRLLTWQPQKQFLSLIKTGDSRAILNYRGFSFHARWCWWLKNWIDLRFMAKYQDYDPPEMMHAHQTSSANIELSRQCGGCGSKTSSRVLQKCLPKLEQTDYDHVLMGLDSPDDIALIAHRAGLSTAVSTDFFTAFVDDPFLLGRIAALNALSDLYAKGATPRAALSIAVLPSGSVEQQAMLLDDLLAGAAREFHLAGIPIVGGHSIMGPKLIFGFTVLGDADPELVPRQSTLSQGDYLVLTKPLGTGVLLAAHMQAACRAEWWTPVIDTMLLSNQHAATAATEARLTAATDVTGFGLAGHLHQMLTSSRLAAELSLRSLPLLPGAAALLENGFESTLAPSNRECCTMLNISPDLRENSAVNILFDPQTSGGMLLAVPARKLDQLLSKCGKRATVIGRVVEDGQGENIRLLP